MSIWDVVRLPFRSIREGYWQLRKAVFTNPRPGGTYLHAEVTAEELEAGLGRQSYAPNWEFSYYERGEVLNLAQVIYDEQTIDGDTYVWFQTHVRAWEAEGDGLHVHGHWELEPTENHNAHLDHIGVSIPRGMENLAAALDEAGIEHAEVELEETTVT